MAASRRMTVSGSTLRLGARQSVSESWESRCRAWVDSMIVLYLPPNASVLADQKEVLTGEAHPAYRRRACTARGPRGLDRPRRPGLAAAAWRADLQGAFS